MYVLFVQQMDGESRKLTEDDSTLEESPNFQSCTYKPGCKTGTKKAQEKKSSCDWFDTLKKSIKVRKKMYMWPLNFYLFSIKLLYNIT